MVVVAGGIGLAPLRLAIKQLIANRDRYRAVALLYGARSPDEMLFFDELQCWREAGIDVKYTVDSRPGEWDGRVGLVTKLIPIAGFEGPRTTAMICGPEVMMRFVTAGAPGARRPATSDPRLAGAEHEVRDRPLRPLPARPPLRLQGRPGLLRRPDRHAAGGEGAVSAERPKLAVWKFASCDGCQLSLLDFERELVSLPEQIEVAYFLEATRGEVEGPYDLSLVEGSITTPSTTPSGSRRCGRSRGGW